MSAPSHGRCFFCFFLHAVNVEHAFLLNREPHSCSQLRGLLDSFMFLLGSIEVMPAWVSSYLLLGCRVPRPSGECNMNHRPVDGPPHGGGCWGGCLHPEPRLDMALVSRLV